MKPADHLKNWAVRLLLTLLLLSAQGFSMAHELDHASGSDNGVICEVCSAGQSFSAGVTVDHFTISSEPHSTHHLHHVQQGPQQVIHSPYPARAPPSHYGI